ncbi:MAG: LuxR C-terminal-related transcriptional regulator [Anaerolineae bacterium]|nr:LuxR C-terminal-related transcriptional regulator [Anaerolineae bacterium]
MPRPHLIERLSAGLDARKLTLVSAPAGSGKTSLIIAWLSELRLARSDLALAWLSLDDKDNDPLRFFAYLVAALQSVDPRLGGEALHLLERTGPPPVEPLVTSLINGLAGRPSPVILVLDDYHAIDDLTIHEAVGLLLERQPPQVHLAITTRHDPPLPLSRLRGRGQMTEIRQGDLRFTLEETASFLNRSMGLQLTPAEVATLEERTEGWITGLQLAALSMQGRDRENVARFIAGFTGRYHFILEYLADEVLQRQPPALQEFLLQTSILERLSGSLCDQVRAYHEAEGSDRVPVTPVPDFPIPGTRSLTSESLLEHLEAANLFVVPLDDERRWYRYHHLFAELLRARLQETQPELVPVLHRRAADWHEQAGFATEAVHHALATRDMAFAAESIERAILRTATWSRVDTALIQSWLNALPAEAVEPRPWLRLFLSRIQYVSGQRELAGQTLQSLEKWLQDHPTTPEAKRLLNLTVVDRASYAVVLGHVQQATELLGQSLAHAPQDDPISRFRKPAILGMAHLRAGEVSEAHRDFSEASEIALAAKLNFAAVPFLCSLAEVEFTQGRLRQAMQTCERAGQLAIVEGKPSTAAGFVGLEMSKVLYEWNDLGAAESHLLEGLELLSESGISESFGSGHAVLAQIRQALGDEEGARRAAQQAVQIAQQENVPRIAGLTLAYQARLWLAQGQLALAARWADDYRQQGETEYLREFEDLTLVRVLLAQGNAADALARLDQYLVAARAAGRGNAVIEIYILRALATPDPGKAMEALGQALHLGEPEGYVRQFLDAGEPALRLLQQAAVRGIAPGYTARLLAAFGPAPGARRAAAQPLVEPLSARELEVLHLLAEDLSNREIGRRLFISLPTVKSHTRNIYDKLSVHDREEAVARARDLNILPTQ